MRSFLRWTLAALAVPILVFAPNTMAVSPAHASESISYNFNTSGDLATYFNSVVTAGTITQSASGGIGNTGALEADPSVTTNAVLATKDGYSLGPVGSTYTFTSQMRSYANGGYSGMGFTSLTPSSSTASGTPYHPNDAIGASVHGGGFVFHNGTTNVNGDWGGTYSNPGSNGLYSISSGSGITTGCNDAGQDNCWYQIVFKITRDSTTTFDARLELYGSSQSGALDSPTPIAVFELRDQVNATLTAAPQLYSYVNFSGQRMKYFDDFQVALAGGASVIAAGAPVVLTSSASESSGVVTISGNVTSDAGASITDRGFVYGTVSNPTVSDSKQAVGSGTGTFSGTTSALSGGTYYFRTYATNSVGTSYGSQESISIGFALSYKANTTQHQAGSLAAGSSLPADASVEGGTNFTVASAASRTGFVFVEWNTAADGSGTSYVAGASRSMPSSNLTLYAQWSIPQAARLFGQTDSSAVRQETIASVTTSTGSALAGNVRGITTNGASVFFIPSNNAGVLREVDFNGKLKSDHTVTGSAAALSAFAAVASGQRDLTYSKGCIFFRTNGDADSGLYCIDTSSWSVTQVTISGSGFLQGQGWLTGNLVDFPDGRIGAVSYANQASALADCPVGFQCKTLRVYTVSGSGGASASVTFQKDILLADTESGWPSDDHGIATDGTYLYQSWYNRGYKVWALASSGPSYLVFNGDGSGTCGANTGASGGSCLINFSKGGKTVVNATYFGRDHVNRRYLMGDFGSAQFVYTAEATDQPVSEFTIAAPSAPQTVSATGGDATAAVSWTAPSSIGGGPIISYTVTSTPGSFTCTTAGTSCTVTGLNNGTSYTFSVVAANNGGNSPGASSGAVTPSSIPKINQADLDFVSSNAMEIGATLVLSAAGGSGSGALTYALASGTCVLSGSNLTASGAGTCVVTATRAADSTYNAKTSGSFSVTVSQVAQTINFSSAVPSSAVAGTTYTPTASATSALVVVFTITSGSPTVCELAAGVVTFKQSGSCVVTASQPGNSTYAAAPSATQTIVAGKINQTITFPVIADKDYDDPAFTAGATLSSGRSVAYVSGTSSQCSVGASSGIVTVNTIGACTITASSSATASYAAASSVSRTFTISPVLAGVPNLSSVSFGDSSVTVAFVAPGNDGGDDIDAYQVVATRTGETVTKPDCAVTSPCTISGLTNGQDYTLTIHAVNAAGIGPASIASPSVTPAAVPNAITGFTTVPGSSQLQVDWTALSDSGLGGGTFTRYDLSLQVRGEAWQTAVTPDGTNALATRSTSAYTFTGLTNGVAYDVKIVAVTSANSSQLSSNTVFAWGVPATVPDSPTGLTLTALSNTSVLASWSSPANDGGATITVYATNPSCAFINAADSYCTLSGLSPGSTVAFSVQATNLVGSSTAVSASITMGGQSSGSSSSSSGGGTDTTPTTTTVATSPPVVAPARVIVPTQPTPIPRALSAPVRSPGRGFDPSVGTRATIGGAPATVTSTPLTNRGVLVRSGSLQMGFNVSGNGGGVSTNPSSNTPELTIPTGQSTRVTGGGLLPGSHMQVWLPGATGLAPKELARVSVGSDGTFDSQLSFTANQSQTPIPIGRQVMQVTGYDADGNQTVVDMTVNIAQGSPAPEPNRLVDALPELQPGQSLATSAGVPEIVTIEARPDTREVAVTSGEWAFNVSLPADGGGVEQVAAGATVTLVQSRSATVSGNGFQPGTRVDIWLFSTPTLLGSVVVGADGSFVGDVYLDSRFAVTGEHTLQLQGVAMDGFIKAANLGVVVQESVVLATTGATTLMLWVGVVAGLVAVLFLVALLVARRRRRFVKGGYTTGLIPVTR